MKGLLGCSVKEEKCDTVPQHIRDLETTLAAQYNTKNNPHMALENKRVGNLIAEREKMKAEAFKRLETPGQEASYDMELFMRKYFLDENEMPDRSKMSRPLVLTGYNDRYDMHARAEEVPGLETHSGGQGNVRTLVIGWSRSAVWAEAGNIDKAQRADRENKKDAEWAESMKTHDSFVKSLTVSAEDQSFSAECATGSYVVQCDKATGYDELDGPMHLSITEAPGGLVGSFDFAVLEGIMRFDVSEAALLDREDSGSEEEDEDESVEDDERTALNPPSNKRQAPSTATNSTAKRVKSTSTEQTRRLYLKWRGRETGEGEIQVDYFNSNTGYIDFLDAACTTFDGRFSADLLGKNVPFQGYRVGYDFRPMTGHWSDYSERAHEYARVVRWR
ncbi:hypothetical protein BU16DRAFT_28504 [Lophium mytilinum]|uniref:R3H domain-containing protein n=1 Tax=Lophium mytilinum TaxID=390894 RepID=A0A6A6RH40_9PEZI|nr:hypothetical protein BU16DRAFT_28504 [Lophium mytilinum]